MDNRITIGSTIKNRNGKEYCVIATDGTHALLFGNDNYIVVLNISCTEDGYIWSHGIYFDDDFLGAIQNYANKTGIIFPKTTKAPIKKKYNYCIICTYMDCYGNIRISHYYVCRTNRKEYFEALLECYRKHWLDGDYESVFHYVSYYDIINDKLYYPPMWYDYECICGDRVLEICDFDEFKNKLTKKKK